MQTGNWNASFSGASSSRLYHDWAVGALSPDREIQYSLSLLRSRARDLVRNNPYATGIVEAFADNIVGWKGIRLKPTVRVSGQPDESANTEIIRGWMDWGEHGNPTVDGQDSWLALQRLIVKSWVADGEVFIRERKGFGNRHGYALQLIDPDLLDERFNRVPDERGVEIRMGIEVDGDGRRLAYHFFRRHPSERPADRTRVRIPADEIIHWFVRYRPGQTRGFSLFAPVLTTIKMIDGLTEAELVASRLAAAKMGFITNNTPEAIAVYAERLGIQNDDLEGELSPRDMEIAPGVIEELMPGQGFEDFDPTHPNTAFEAFLKVMLRGVARAFSMSYLTLTGDVGEANYSSMRAGLLPERDHWRCTQVSMYETIHQPVYKSWIGMALLSRTLRLRTSDPTHYFSHKWRPRGWKWVDPLKDMLGAELGIALGATSRQRIAADQGHDYETIVRELAEEEAFAGRQGVDVGGLKRSGASSGDRGSENGNGRRRGADELSRIQALMEVSENGS